MLFHRAKTRRLWLAVFTVVAALVMAAPVLVLVLAAFAGSWTSVLPTSWTFSHVRQALSDDAMSSLLVSVDTALVASTVAVVTGTWAALAARALPRGAQAFLSTVMYLPAAIPSVVVGLGVLIALGGPPLMLSGTPWMVIVAQTSLVMSFAYSSVSSAAERLDPRLSYAASSLGASPGVVLFRVELPLLLPAIQTSFGLSFSLAMGELGATIMVYPPGWRSLPVTIFTVSDRGDIFTAAAFTLVLVVVSVSVTAISRARVTSLNLLSRLLPRR